jgi:hypothetical protein
MLNVHGVDGNLLPFRRADLHLGVVLRKEGLRRGYGLVSGMSAKRIMQEKYDGT